MIADIVKQLSGLLGTELVSKFQLNTQQSKQAVEVVGNSLTETLQQELAKGNISQITSLFADSSLNAKQIAENPMVKTLVSAAVVGISAKVGLSAAIAQPVATFVVPKIIETLRNQTNGNPSEVIKTLGGTDNLLQNLSGNLGDSLKKGLGGFFK